MKRIIKFRVWDEGEKAFNTPKLIGNGFPSHFTGTVLEQFTKIQKCFKVKPTQSK